MNAPEPDDSSTSRASAAEPAPLALETVLDRACTESGESLLALSRRAPLLLVFLRHFG